MKNHGFTLTELMIVIAILGLLLAIAVPAITGEGAGREALTCRDPQTGEVLFKAEGDRIQRGEKHWMIGDGGKPTRFYLQPEHTTCTIDMVMPRPERG